MSYSASSANSSFGSSQEIVWNHPQQRLEIDWSAVFGYPCKLYVTGWDKGLNWWSETDGEKYRPGAFEEPGIHLLSETDHPAIIKWQETIPENVLHACRYYSSWQYALLQMARHWQEGCDLLLSNPTLLWLLWDQFIQERYSLAVLRHTLRQKQPVIMSSIGLVGSKSAVRQMKKLTLSSLGVYEERFIRQVWRNAEQLDQLKHHKIIDMDLLQLLDRFPWIPGSALYNAFENVTCRWAYEQLCILIRDSLDMGATEERMRQCQTMDQVRRVHDRLVQNHQPENGPRNFGALLNEKGEMLPFPEPPFPGTDIISPICTPEGLKAEGKLMQHCVSSYIRRVQEGHYFVYHMDYERPLTIGFKMAGGKVTGLDQVAGIRNAAPDEEAAELIKEWLMNAPETLISCK